MNHDNNPFQRRPPTLASRPHGVVSMAINGLTCVFNMPPALRSRYDRGADEVAHGLPPRAPREAYLVDDLPAAPASWPRSSETESSYLVVVEGDDEARARRRAMTVELLVARAARVSSGREFGMWLDFTGNAKHAHDIAVVVSVQGVNPLTGPIGEEKADCLRLVQYRERCPVHGISFNGGKPERFCRSCNRQWPAQNYLSTTTGSSFWLDGFVTEDGTVRQFVFTEDVMRGVAAHVLGDERSFSVGVAFYRSAVPKPKPKRGYDPLGYGPQASDGEGDDELSLEAYKGFRGENSRSMEVAAGARIRQEVGVDPNEPGYWAPEPAGVIYVNYVDGATADQILASGYSVQPRPSSEGWLAGFPVGHGHGKT